MADDLPAVLTLLHESGKRWRTLRADGEEWVHEERSTQAFLRSVPPGSVVSARGTPGPADRDPTWKLWVRQPDRSRVDFGLGHGHRMVMIVNGQRMCSSDLAGGYRVGEHHREQDASLGPATHLVRPWALPAILDVEVEGRGVFLGRPVLRARGRPRPAGDIPSRSLTMGADELAFAVDAERGVLLWLESRYQGMPFRRLSLTAVAFDEDLDDGLFAFPDAVAEDEVRLPVPPEPVRPPRPGRPQPGPPDLVLGQPVPTRVVVARGPSFVVAVDRVVAYPTGFELGVTVRTREEPVHGSFDVSRRRSWSGTAAFPGESLQVRVAGEVTVVPVSGSGTQARFDQRYWVAPLPPAGPVTVVVEWPARQLGETGADLDGDAIREAAARADALWP